MAAIKLTALGRPQLLMNLSQVLIENKRYYDEQKKLQKTDDRVFHELTGRSIKRTQVDSVCQFYIHSSINAFNRCLALI